MSSTEATQLFKDFESSADKYAQSAGSFEWTDVQLVAADPVKGQGVARRDQLMISRLDDILGDFEKRLDLVSAYFVPGKAGTEYFASLAETGKDVRILTNALNINDVLMVHAGYSKYRRELLEAGVDLYELKLRGNMTPETDMQIKPLGLSGARLHAKTFAVDDSRIFIGCSTLPPALRRSTVRWGS